MVNIACIDLEGVLMPEMWPHIGSMAGIPGLSATTREEPDYPKLMKRRIGLLRQHGLTLRDVQAIVDEIQPLEGAIEFIAFLQRRYQVVILSDAFHELADHLGSYFAYPEFQCHRLHIANDDFVTVRIAECGMRNSEVSAHTNAGGLEFQKGAHRIVSRGQSKAKLRMEKFNITLKLL